MKLPAEKPLLSPEVHPDRTVTFRVKAPFAQKVLLALEGADELPMRKDASGVWSYTSPALAPDIYGYAFVIDGTAMLDPLNPEIKNNLVYVGNMVTVPGSPPELWEVQDVPHGTLHQVFYKSEAIGDQRDMFIYTPPGYDASADPLPILYLLHGYSDTAIGWSGVGKAHVVLDNLISQGRTKPMIVVMTLGYGVANFASHAEADPFNDKARVKQSYERYRDGLFDEVMPYVEAHYRVNGQRAIAGLSMGGMETLFVGLNAAEEFQAIGAFSSGGFFDVPEAVFSTLSVNRVNQMRPFYLACGVDDWLIDQNREIARWLKAQGVQVELLETPGRHTWMVWRRNLIEFASAIFKD